MNAPTARPRRWRAQLGDTVEALQAWPWLETGRTLLARFREDRLGVTAGSLTFTTTIALVPLVTVALAIFSAFPIFSSLRSALQNYLFQSLVPDAIARPVIGALTRFAEQANHIGTVGLVALVVTALMLMLTIDRTLNNIWRVRKPRPIAQRVLVYWAAMTLGPLLLAMSLSLTSYAVSASRGLVGQMPGLLRFVLDWGQFALFALGIAGLYRHVPNIAVRWPHALSGGLFAAVGLEVAKDGLAWYIGRVPTFSAVYGAFATVPIFLVWIYLMWVVVLLGAVVAAYAPSLQLRVARRVARPGHRFVLAVELLRELAAHRADGRRGLSLDGLSRHLRADPLQLEPILETLLGLDWIGRLDEERDPRFVLLRNPPSTPAQPLIEALLLGPDAAVLGFWHRAGLVRMSLADLLAHAPDEQASIAPAFAASRLDPALADSALPGETA